MKTKGLCLTGTFTCHKSQWQWEWERECWYLRIWHMWTSALGKVVNFSQTAVCSPSSAFFHSLVSCRLFFQVYLHCHFSKTLDPAIWVQFTLYHLRRPDSLKKDMNIYFLTWNTPQSTSDTENCEDQRLVSLCNSSW